MNTDPTIFVVDDNPSTREALARLLESAGLRAETCPDAKGFLDSYDPARPGCLLLDIRMPGMSGLELQEKLARDRVRIPVIIVSAHSEVENVVRAIKAGAVDFVKKPYRGAILLERIRQALELDARIRLEERERAGAAARRDLLSPREREVMDLLVAGLSVKQIAFQLSLSPTTVNIHRGNIMRKLQAASVVDLVHVARLCGTNVPNAGSSTFRATPLPGS